MKKLFLLLSFISIVLTSCSSNDSASNNEVYVLPSKTIYTNNAGQVFTTHYTYNGNKIVSANMSNIIRRDYTYTNDLITKLEFVNVSSEFISSRYIFTYDSSQRLVQEVSTDIVNNLGIKSVYVYNNDGTVNETVYIGTTTAQNTLESSSKHFVGTNGEIIKVETYTSAGTTTYNYNYDNKNNPFKYVLNLNKIQSFGNNFYNQINSTTTDPSNVIINTSTSSYTYNSDNFPLSVVVTSVSNSGSTSTTSTQYFY